MRGAGAIVVEGYTELQRDIKRQLGKLPAEIGEAHKEIGRFIIEQLPPANPNAVGAGSGSTVRPSATKRDILLRVGHGARAGRWAQWGKKPVQPFESGRPYIMQTIRDHQSEIEEMFLKKLGECMDPAFYKVQV